MLNHFSTLKCISFNLIFYLNLSITKFLLSNFENQFPNEKIEFIKLFDFLSSF